MIRSRLLRFAVSSALVLGAGGLVAAAGSGAAPVPRCLSTHLSLKFVSFQGATGHRFWQLAFKNVGSTCKFHGFPRVAFLNGSGHVIHESVRHESGPVPTVTVAHGKRGHFTVTYLDGGFCTHSFLASRLRIFPPQDAGAFVFNPVPANHGQISVCRGSARVSPVRATPGG